MKKQNSKKKAINLERGKKKGLKESRRRKLVKAKMVKRRETARHDKVRKEQKFQEYMNNLIGQ